MKGNNKAQMPLQLYSEEKQKEFQDMPPRARLRWLEDANAFINKAIGFERRAESDERFKVFTVKRSAIRKGAP
jgi:hypothetical protein